jgi:inorganic triphosphatase YgiF
MEIEAKLLVKDAGVLENIARREHLGPYRLRAGRRRTLETVYLDTARRDLGHAGIALRIRKIGRQVELTMKELGRVSKGVHRRPEWTRRLRRLPRMPFRLPRGKLGERISSVTRGADLAPLLITTVVRRALLVYRPGRRRALAEIDLDRVVLRRPRRRWRASPEAGARFFEVEVELKAGSERDLGRIVRLLRCDYPLKPSRLSKLARGLRWAGAAARRGSRKRRLAAAFRNRLRRRGDLA